MVLILPENVGRVGLPLVVIDQKIGNQIDLNQFVL